LNLVAQLDVIGGKKGYHFQILSADSLSLFNHDLLQLKQEKSGSFDWMPFWAWKKMYPKSPIQNSFWK